MEFIQKIRNNKACVYFTPLLFLCLLALRRGQQLLLPQVWNEDGVPNPLLNDGIGFGSNVADYISNGWLAFFEPVNGYLITVPKIISAISLGLSFSNYPIISTIIAWLFISLVGLSVIISPTYLKGRFYCALSLFLIPTDPEVFGIPLYTFWWASLFVLLVALWDLNRPNIVWRIVLLALGGLSSPVIVLMLPIFYFRAFKFRSVRLERLVAVIATVIAVIQVFFMLRVSAGTFPALMPLLTNVIPVFFGKFLVGNLTDNPALLWCVAGLLLGVIVYWFCGALNQVSAWILIYFLVGAIAITCARVDLGIIHPRLAGPRYFFFPFIALFWILIQVFMDSKTARGKFFVSLFIIAAILNSIPAWARQHDDLNWLQHVISCRQFLDYTIPIQTDGKRDEAWRLKLKGKKCDDLLKKDFLFDYSQINLLPTFSYRVLGFELNADKGDGLVVVSTTMLGTDFYRSSFSGFRVLGSFVNSDTDVGEVVLKLNRGDRFLYRSGPGFHGQSMSVVGHESEFIGDLPSAKDWIILDFSNSKLPNEFLVRIVDQGRGWGEWSAIAIRN